VSINPVQKRGTALIVAIACASMALVGCGETPTRVGGDVPGPDAPRTASLSQTPGQLANSFAATVRAQGLTAHVKGGVVTLTASDGTPLSYDFSQTPKTNKVTFRAGDVVTTFDYNGQVGHNTIPWNVIWIAVKMVWGGAKAWWWYTHTHQGPDFNQEDLVKAIVYGMVQGAVGALPAGFLWDKLLPYVWKWITGEDPIAPSIAAAFDRMKGDINAVAQIVQDAQKASQH
jgi:hypothetical protein